METHENSHRISQYNESWLSRHRWISYGVLVVIAYYLFIEHREHVIAYLPYLLLGACLFMHGGHHHHSNKQNKTEDNKS